MSFEDACRKGAATLVDVCARLAKGERAHIISEPETQDVAAYVERAARERTDQVIHDTVAAARIHGTEPSETIAGNMKWANVVFCLTKMSMAHTAARKTATDAGTRFLSLPDYSLELLASPCLQFDFENAVLTSSRLTSLLSSGKSVRVTTALGTDFTFDIANRNANDCPGLCDRPGMLASPPDSEVNVAPVEGNGHGTIVVDGSITCRELGKLRGPVRLTVKNSMISAIEGETDEAKILEGVFERAPNERARILGEFGVGLNTLAQLTGRMLEDEGCSETVHFGFGSNSTIGGLNRVAFHLDFIVRKPNVWVDGSILIEDGVLRLAPQ